MKLTIKDNEGKTGDITALSFRDDTKLHAVVMRIDSTLGVYFNRDQLKNFSSWLNKTADAMAPVQPRTFVGTEDSTI